jgi:protocatechuate 3,4-dioxygenase beta subunit
MEELSQIADQQGIARFKAGLGAGALLVTPAAGDAAAAWQGQILASDRVVEVRCAGRVVVQGRVIDFRSRAEPGAEVRLERMDAAPGGSAAQVQLFATHSGHDGAFQLFVDPGRYAVIVVPAEGAGLARTLAKVVEIAPSAEPLTLDLTLPAPIVLHGRVLDADARPLAGVLVDVLAPELAGLSRASLWDPSAPAMSMKILHETHLLGTGVSDVDGRFALLIASGQVGATAAAP